MQHNRALRPPCLWDTRIAPVIHPMIICVFVSINHISNFVERGIDSDPGPRNSNDAGVSSTKMPLSEIFEFVYVDQDSFLLVSEQLSNSKSWI
ncbi:hypothetical protein KCU62_g333, partial [Aureobasidium sp. EXF-3399]